jgi:hypothetical protein
MASHLAINDRNQLLSEADFMLDEHFQWLLTLPEIHPGGDQKTVITVSIVLHKSRDA